MKETNIGNTARLEVLGSLEEHLDVLLKQGEVVYERECPCSRKPSPLAEHLIEYLSMNVDIACAHEVPEVLEEVIQRWQWLLEMQGLRV